MTYVFLSATLDYVVLQERAILDVKNEQAVANINLGSALDVLLKV